MKKKRTYEYMMPIHFMPAIINGDVSGLPEEDQKIYAGIINTFTTLCDEGEFWELVEAEADSESYFSKNPDFIELGCNVCDVILIIFEKE